MLHQVISKFLTTEYGNGINLAGTLCLEVSEVDGTLLLAVSEADGKLLIEVSEADGTILLEVSEAETVTARNDLKLALKRIEDLQPETQKRTILIASSILIYNLV